MFPSVVSEGAPWFLRGLRGNSLANVYRPAHIGMLHIWIWLYAYIIPEDVCICVYACIAYIHIDNLFILTINDVPPDNRLA